MENNEFMFNYENDIPVFESDVTKESDVKKYSSDTQSEIKPDTKSDRPKSRPGRKAKYSDSQLTEKELKKRNNRRKRNKAAATQNRAKYNDKIKNLQSTIKDLNEENEQIQKNIEQMKISVEEKRTLLNQQLSSSCSIFNLEKQNQNEVNYLQYQKTINYYDVCTADNMTHAVPESCSASHASTQSYNLDSVVPDSRSFIPAISSLFDKII